MNFSPDARGQPDPAGLPLSLYVHLPWCVRKCPYCDFNSHAAREPIPEAAYLDALLADLRRSRQALGGRQFATVFFGGGTPSLFSPAAIGRVLDAVAPALVADAEITLEANPGTVDAARFAGFRAAGVNRLSLGVQSFDDRALQRLGRVHDGAAARRAVAAAAACFGRFSIDLMYGLPGQTPAEAARDAQLAAGSGAGHLSCYQLTIEPNTVFHSHPPALPDEATAAAIETAVHAGLARAGLARYEISNWAVPGEECRHNLNYWQFGDYLGIGAGAHSKLTHHAAIRREARYRVPQSYQLRALAGQPVAETRTLGAADLPAEFLMNALRQPAGFPLALFTQRTGLAAGVLATGLARAQALELLAVEVGQVRATPRGLRYLNRLLEIFLPE